MALKQNEIRRDIRQDISDAMLLEEVDRAGSLNDVEFLGRLFDLKALPSKDYRFDNAAHDIRQHTVNNYDWGREWICADHRCNILWCEDDLFLQILAETIHPVVRPDREKRVRESLISTMNSSAASDGSLSRSRESLVGRDMKVGK
ncbi:MAG: hypothetical protein O7G83_09090 [Proteobacteria bacterium]|nr:hypothetical protein [Pseudomonadota bacterium]